MGNFEIATKANTALVLPSLLIAGHLEQTGPLLPTPKTFQEAVTLDGQQSIQLTLDDGIVLSGEAIVQYLSRIANAANNDASLPWTSVCIYSTGVKMSANNLV
jgi:hypothetical protein